MECPCCKHGISFETFISMLHIHENVDIPLEYTHCFVLNNHEAFRHGIKSLLNNKTKVNFFEKDHQKKRKINRPILIHSSDTFYTFDNECDDDDDELMNMPLLGMKINHLYEDQQLSLWIVTKPEPTNLIDGTIYMIVRDKFDFHIRLVIRNWCYVTPKKEYKTFEELSNILNELLPIDSMIKINNPLLTKCHIDNQLTIRCDSPNVELILSDRIKKYFVTEKLEDVRSRGNQSYIHGHFQLALDYYTFAINRIVAMAGQVLSKDNECEINLFRNAFSQELSRLHSNRSSCYLQERLYSGASLDSFIVVTGRYFDQTYDEYFLKCLYRLLCSKIGSHDYSGMFEQFFEFSQNSSINFPLRLKYFGDFDQIKKNLPRLKDESEKGKFDLKKIFENLSFNQNTFFDIENFHSNFKNKFYLKKRNSHFYAKCSIPSGTLLLVQNAFAFVQTKDVNPEHRLLNEIEKHLIMSPSRSQFDTISSMPVIKRWLDNQTDFYDDDDDGTPPKTFPWSLLLKTQEKNPFRSKSIVGWWPEACAFKINKDINKQANCLWFICDKMLFIFNYIPISKNDELLIANNSQIQSFIDEHQNDFIFSVGQHNKIRLNEIIGQLKETQIYFEQ